MNADHTYYDLVARHIDIGEEQQRKDECDM